jgi:hypothetical protein
MSSFQIAKAGVTVERIEPRVSLLFPKSFPPGGPWGRAEGGAFLEAPGAHGSVAAPSALISIIYIGA